MATYEARNAGYKYFRSCFHLPYLTLKGIKKAPAILFGSIDEGELEEVDKVKPGIRHNLDFDGSRYLRVNRSRARDLHLDLDFTFLTPSWDRSSQDGSRVEKMMLAHATIPLILYGLFPQLNLLALLFGSNVSNFDVVPTLLRKGTPANAITELHGRSLLHAPFFFIVALPLLIYSFGFVAAISFCLGGMIHIAIECFDEKGRPLLYPFSKRLYGVPKFPYDFWTYTTSKRMVALEAALFIGACISFLVRLFFT